MYCLFEKKRRGFLVASLTLILFFGLTNCSSTNEVTEVSSTPLKTTYADFFPIGAAVAAGEDGFDSFTTYSTSLLSEFNSLVAENCMKPGVIHPEEDTFEWDAADKIVAFAKEHNMKVRGHVLVWHNQTGSWMFTDTGTTEEKRAFAKEKMEAHIEAMLNRYKDDVYCWDVVNEAVKDNWDSSSWNSIYRESSPWYTAYGDGTFIQDAFKKAHELAPDALLFYNDYNVYDSQKRARIVSMIEDLDLINHGLTGIGIQAHWSLTYPTLSQIQETIDVFHSMGLDVQITELDIDCYSGSSDSTTKPYEQFETALAKRYDELFTLFRENKDKISNVTFWGVADDHTWLDTFYGGTSQSKVRKNYPFLFDSDHQKKKAYFSVSDF